MKISDQEIRNVWLSFAAAVVSSVSGDEQMSLDDLEEDACKVADTMLDAYLSRFDPDYVNQDPEPPKRKKRTR